MNSQSRRSSEGNTLREGIDVDWLTGLRALKLQ